MSATPPSPKPASVPASAPIASVIAGAAVTAVYAAAPIASGASPNWALAAALFLVTFGAVLASALYHVQIPSPVQQAGTAALTTALDAAMTKLETHTPAANSTDVPTR